ncbi:MAG: hypothetical protein WBZ22_15715, partial [Pseudolabrys sp.]
ALHMSAFGGKADMTYCGKCLLLTQSGHLHVDKIYLGPFITGPAIRLTFIRKVLSRVSDN